MHRYSPSSPTCPNPPMTYDEASLQGSRQFFMALQELKNLRPQLYSAAEYCESSYLFNDQKQVVLDNLKDYTVKALVNAVDHLGTVAYKLNEVLSQQTTDVSSAEIRIASLSQRIRICQGHTNLEGLNQQRTNKPKRRYHKHYVLPDVVPNAMDEKLGERKREKAQDSGSKKSHPVVDSGRTLSWHLAADPFTASKEGHSPVQQHASRLRSSGGGSGSSISELEASSKLVGSSSGAALPMSHTHEVEHSQATLFDSQKPLSSHPSFDEKYKVGQRAVAPAPTRSKSLLSSLLGRRRSTKQLRGQT